MSTVNFQYLKLSNISTSFIAWIIDVHGRGLFFSKVLLNANNRLLPIVWSTDVVLGGRNIKLTLISSWHWYQADIAEFVDKWMGWTITNRQRLSSLSSKGSLETFYPFLKMFSFFAGFLLISVPFFFLCEIFFFLFDYHKQWQFLSRCDCNRHAGKLYFLWPPKHFSAGKWKALLRRYW